MANDTAAPAAVPPDADIGLTRIRDRVNAVMTTARTVKGRVDAATAAKTALDSALAVEKRARQSAEAQAARLTNDLETANSLLRSRDDTIADLQRQLVAAGKYKLNLAEMEAVVLQLETTIAELEASSQRLSGGSRTG